ncbi:DUF7575 domain-containing protein [Halopelagius longus]|uniref:Zinc ribbon domain-containing protein n=1 Tax=Halopelagius longus TaxID=1236180 RepID=A0A1H0YI71_9EURY|nr:zinc ribbon domain-containing protein [Halopelagius longus]RDI72495.1 zinc ribbon domain-containing protein [Halopelagius longus]SDQ14616.1 hypothetical protein SAMN05216278_0639 [Halopelagius longus]
MSQSVSRKRPWLAALLGALATGLGHVYLRRWRRAFGWVAVLFAVSVLFVDQAALSALAAGDAVDVAELTPLLIAGGLSIADAYLLARIQNAAVRLTVTPDGRLNSCPNCGKELDSELDFCHWCTAELDDFEAVIAERSDERGRRTRQKE